MNTLTQMVVIGQFTGESFIGKAGMDNWERVSSVDERK